jgi:L,D-transpeptidase ErfK/SrfK
MKMKRLQWTLFLVVLFFPLISSALSFLMPKGDNDLIGYIQTAVVQRGESINSLARKYNVGFLELLEANPKVDFNYLRSGTKLIIPTKYVLPNAPHKDIVINLAELRLYYFLPNRSVVTTYPIGIGREGDETPVIETSILEKIVNPTWYPTEDTRKKELLRGIVLPEFIEPGPNNPLGKYAMRLKIWNYLIHGTNDPGGVGLRISGGCIRMYPEDVEKLFSMIKIGTPVNIVNQPIKLGWHEGVLYAESHVPMHLKKSKAEDTLTSMSEVLSSYTQRFSAEVDWNLALAVAEAQEGLPEKIGRRMVQ